MMNSAIVNDVYHRMKELGDILHRGVSGARDEAKAAHRRINDTNKAVDAVNARVDELLERVRTPLTGAYVGKPGGITYVEDVSRRGVTYVGFDRRKGERRKAERRVHTHGYSFRTSYRRMGTRRNKRGRRAYD